MRDVDSRTSRAYAVVVRRKRLDSDFSRSHSILEHASYFVQHPPPKKIQSNVKKGAFSIYYASSIKFTRWLGEKDENWLFLRFRFRKSRFVGPSLSNESSSSDALAVSADALID